MKQVCHIIIYLRYYCHKSVLHFHGNGMIQSEITFRRQRNLRRCRILCTLLLYLWLYSFVIVFENIWILQLQPIPHWSTKEKRKKKKDPCWQRKNKIIYESNKFIRYNWLQNQTHNDLISCRFQNWMLSFSFQYVSSF